MVVRLRVWRVCSLPFSLAFFQCYISIRNMAAKDSLSIVCACVSFGEQKRRQLAVAAFSDRL